jgi:hypothetical protein
MVWVHVCVLRSLKHFYFWCYGGILSAGSAEENSPQRKLWEKSPDGQSPGRGERGFLSLLPKLWICANETHGFTVSYYRAPLRGLRQDVGGSDSSAK